MKKVLFGLSLFLFIMHSGVLKAVEFEELSADKKLLIYKESCEEGQMANCYQVAVWYKRYQRFDSSEVSNLRTTVEALKEKRKNLKIADESSELNE